MPFWMRLTLITAVPAEVEEAVAGHLDHVAELGRAGRLRLSGTLARGDGFVEVFEAADLLDAERIAESSPLVQEGLASWLLRELTDLRP